MKGKLFYVLMSLLVSFSFVNNVYAEESLKFSFTASQDKMEVDKAGEIVTLKLNLKSNSAISNCTFSLNHSGGIEVSSKEALNNWSYEEGSEKIYISTSLGTDALTNGQDVFSLKYKVNGVGKVNISNIECVSTMTEGTDEDGNPTEIKGSASPVIVDLQVKDITNVTTLSSLSVTNGQLGSSFSSEQYSYVIKLDQPNFSLTMTPTNEKYKNNIKVYHVTDPEKEIDSSNITFDNDGGQTSMKLKVRITGEDSDNYSDYTLIVNYEQKELDNSLATLVVGDKKVELVSGKYDYKVEMDLDESVTSIKVLATLTDSENFKFNEIAKPATYDFKKGVAYATLIVEPKSSTLGVDAVTYRITITRKGSQVTPVEPDKPSTGGNSGGNGTVTENPGTGETSMLVMAFILIVSFTGSIFLYKKNLEGYNK